MFRQSSWNEPLLVELDRRGRRGYRLPDDKDVREILKGDDDHIPDGLRRRSVPPLPSLSEPQVVRHFTRLSQMNLGVDTSFYPLGSCTMKYNPKLSERLASSSELTGLHPLQPEESVQGILQILYELCGMLAEITGMAKFSLAPAAGAQGEFVGALIMKALARERGELDTREEVLVPDSAHGTNPASAAMCGFKVVRVPTSTDGLVDMDALRAKVSRRTAGMMLTVPNTLGVFERDVREISALVHEFGGLMYFDGANMNALLGRARPAEMGFDMVHLNIHKTFSTPHGGGGPGAGPLGVVGELVEYLPAPLIEYDGARYRLRHDLPKSVGRMKGYHGNVAILFRAYCYLLSLGRDGLRLVSEQSVLASNYLLKKLDRDSYPLPYDGALPRKHEFVVSAEVLQKKFGVNALDVAKSLLDEGFYAPTIYFPGIVDEALMIEPTETEAIEELDRFAETLNRIAKGAGEKSDVFKASPRNTVVGRLDEVRASRPLTMTLNWRRLDAWKAMKEGSTNQE